MEKDKTDLARRLSDALEAWDANAHTGCSPDYLAAVEHLLALFPALREEGGGQ